MTGGPSRRSVVLGALGAAVGPAVAWGQASAIHPWRQPCKAPGDLVSVLLEGTGAPAGTVVSFGLAFAPGEVPNGAGLAARVAGHGALPVQLDVVTRHPDGSARFGVAALAAPGLRGGEGAAVLFGRTPGRAGPFDALAALERRQVMLEIGPPGGQRWRSDLLALARHNLAVGEGVWQVGPLAMQLRVTRMIPADSVGGATSLRLVADIAIQADGVLRVDAWLRNDIAMQRGGGQAAYDMRLLLDGRVALRADGLVHPHYTGWGRCVTSRAGGAPATEPPHLRHDVERLADLGAVARYDLSTGVARTLLDEFTAETAAPSWTVPLGPRGIAQNMFVAGGRPDIGPTTRSQAAWLVSGDHRAAAHAIGQAEAAGSVPWHLWDPGGGDGRTGGWLDTRRWPLLWTDPRGGGRPPLGLLAQIPTDTGWAPDCAHQPELSYVPYLLTGRRAFLDGLQAQAAWCVMSQSVTLRGIPGQRVAGANVNVIRGNQTRGVAWSLRQLGNSAWASPDGGQHLPWVAAAEDGNWAWMRANLPAWTEEQGEAHGWIPGYNAGAGDLKPWQQDMVVSSAAAAARRGHADARAVLAWMENFIAGRFLAAERGFNPRDGCAYVLANAPANPNAPAFNSWRKIGAETVARGWSNGGGWAQSTGDYGQWALQSLAALIDVLGSEPARRAYAWLDATAPPFTRPVNFSGGPTLNIVPRGQPRVPAAAPRCRGAS
jgi:hypothetical protein